MALNQKIRLQIISALDDAGIKATADQLDKLQAKVSQAEVSAQGLGKEFKASFNPLEAMTSVATGNINGIVKAAVHLGLAIKGVAVSVGTMTMAFGGIMLGVTLVRKLIDHFKIAKEESDKLSKSMNDAFAKNAADSLAQLKSDYGDYASEIDRATSAKLKELDATQKLIEAEMRRKMVSEGASEDEIKRAQQMSRLKHEQSKADISIDAQKKAEAYRKQILESTKTQMLGLYARSHDQSAEVQKKLDDMRADLEAKEIGYAGIDYAAGDTPVLTEGQKRRVDAQMRKFKESDEYKKMLESYDKTVAEANKAAEFVKTLEAASIKSTEEKKVAEIKAKEDVVSAAADAIAAERKAEDERHQQRMANLKAESDAMRGSLDDAKSRFEREFALYKSADKGASAIEAEKADEAARKQLQKDAARYGGKWRIDELSRLYAAGDEEGVKNRLTEWRKSSRFTPEVESMVRAAAAGENVRTMEDRVAEIAGTVKTLAETMEGLLTMKGE